MKKIIIRFIIFIVIGFVVYIISPILIVLYNKKQEIKPTINMPYSIDTLDFRSNTEADFMSKYGYLNIENSPTFDTIYGSFFSEKYYISIMADTIKLSSIIFDTGSDACIFDINNFDSNRFGKDISLTNVWGDPLPSKELYIDNIVLGKMIYSPNNVPFYGFTIPLNIIGGDILKHFVWKIDNLHRKIYFSQDTSAFSYDDCVAVPFSFNNNAPIIKCYVNGKLYNVKLDTGSPEFLHIVDGTSIDYLSTIPQTEPRDSFFCTTSVHDMMYANIDSLINSVSQREYRTISDINIGNISFNSEIVEHNIFKSNLLGLDFFKRFEYVILDYINQVMYLGPVSELKSFTYMRTLRTHINTIGIHSNIKLKPYTISSITDSLKEAGLSLGDTIIAIDKEPVTNLELLKLFYSRKSATITVKNGNGESNYTLYRSHYLSEPDTVMTYGEIPFFPLYQNMHFFYPMNDDGRVLKYYNWDPPYLIGDKIRIFD